VLCAGLINHPACSRYSLIIHLVIMPSGNVGRYRCPLSPWIAASLRSSQERHYKTKVILNGFEYHNSFPTACPSAVATSRKRGA
jgi:hypothetical protein